MEVVLIALTVIALAAAGVLGAVARRALRENERRSRVRVADLSAGISRDAAPVPTPVPGLFLARTREPQPRTGVAILVLGVVVAGTVGAAALLAGRAQQPPGTPATAAAADEDRAPLELLSLTTDRTGDRFVVRGTVRGPAPSGSIAVVRLFGEDGGFIAAAQSPLAASGPAGTEESFAVEVTGAAAEGGRYRVRFQQDNRVLPHVDRRGAPEQQHTRHGT